MVAVLIALAAAAAAIGTHQATKRLPPAPVRMYLPPAETAADEFADPDPVDDTPQYARPAQHELDHGEWSL